MNSTNQHLVGVFVYMRAYVDTQVQVHMCIYICAYLGADLTWRKKPEDDRLSLSLQIAPQYKRRNGCVTTQLFITMAIMHPALVRVHMQLHMHIQTYSTIHLLEYIEAKSK